MDLIQKALWFFRPRKIIHEQIDPSSLTNGVINEHLFKENAELKGRLAKLESEIRKEKDLEHDQEEENEVKLTLNKRKKELQEAKELKFFSLKSFFWKLNHDPKFRGKLKILSWDRKKVLSPFVDLGFSSDGDLILLDKDNNVLFKTRTLVDMFQSVSGIENDVMNGILPVNLDQDLGFVENLQVFDMPEVVPSKDGKFHYAKAKKRPLYQYVSELRNEISELTQSIEDLEVTNSKLQNKNDELQRLTRVLNGRYNDTRNVLSKTEQEFTGMSKVFTDESNELIKQRLYNTNLEKMKEFLESSLEALREKAEREGTKLHDEKAMEKYKAISDDIQGMFLPFLMKVKESGLTQEEIQKGGIPPSES